MDYLPVRINTLRLNEPTTFDIYIQVSDKFVHYFKNSDVIDGERIEKLRTKGVKKLFILKKNENDYLNYLDQGLDLLQQKKISVKDRGALAYDGLVTLTESIEGSVKTEGSYKRTKSQVSKVIEFLTRETSAARSIMTSVGFSQDVFQHCASVASLSVSLATRYNMTDTQQLLDLGMAAMLHDVALMGSGFDTSLSWDKMSPDQKRIFEAHPEKGSEFLRSKSYVGSAVVAMVMNHEEVGGGAGFPHKKLIKDLSLSSQILNMCNQYDRLCQQKGLNPIDGLDVFFESKLGLFDLEMMKTLARMLKGEES